MKGILDNLYKMTEQMRNRIILHKDTRITVLVILQHNTLSVHSGPDLRLKNVKLQYWAPGGKGQPRKAIRLC